MKRYKGAKYSIYLYPQQLIAVKDLEETISASLQTACDIVSWLKLYNNTLLQDILAELHKMEP